MDNYLLKKLSANIDLLNQYRLYKEIEDKSVSDDVYLSAFVNMIKNESSLSTIKLIFTFLNIDFRKPIYGSIFQFYEESIKTNDSIKVCNASAGYPLMLKNQIDNFEFNTTIDKSSYKFKFLSGSKSNSIPDVELVLIDKLKLKPDSNLSILFISLEYPNGKYIEMKNLQK